jgi:DNA-binding NtrC family response regulator
MSARILIVEDDASFGRIVQIALIGEDAGYAVEMVGDAESAKKLLLTHTFDLVVTDLKLPGMSGVELLDWINETVAPPPAVFVMTAFATVNTAVEAMKKGAADYLTKPFSTDELLIAVKKALRMRDLEDENIALKEALAKNARFENIIGNSQPMQGLFDLMRKVAQRDINVLVRGESGTGKELVARAIHFASPRKNGPFVPVDSVAIPDTLLESELFGYVKGAFTGASRDSKGKIRSANGGTIFLDEIGDMPIELQAKLLRVLQERVVTPIGSTSGEQVDVRVIAATHVDLETAVKEGRFREDLYFRLNVITIRIPPLRDRREDIPILVRHFINRSKPASNGTGSLRVSNDAMDALKSYGWPGNVRELENAVEHAMVLVDGKEILIEHLPESIRGRSEYEKASSVSDAEFVLPDQGVKLDSLEKDLILQALERTEGNQTRAAMLLGISRPTLIYRMEKYGIGKE